MSASGMQDALLAEFTTPAELLEAIGRLREHGYTQLDAFTPFPVHGLDTALGLRRSWLGYPVFAMGLFGAAAGYLVEWWCNAHDYPLNVGGRPYNSLPAFVPIAFEMGVLSAAVSGFLLFFFTAKLPELYHPVFDVPGFERASIDRFWLGVDAADPVFDRLTLESELLALGASQVAATKGRR